MTVLRSQDHRADTAPSSAPPNTIGGPVTQHPGDFTAQLRHASLRDLLAWRAMIDAELHDRDATRTSTSTEGEIAERIVARAYRGILAQPGTKGYDVALEDGTRIQVKTRSLPKGHLRFWEFDTFDFDRAVVISMDRDTKDILFAREYSCDEVRALGTPHPSGAYRLPMGRGRDNGTDVTPLLHAAYRDLGLAHHACGEV